MNSSKMLRSFKYKFSIGPLSAKLLKNNIKEGNCRLAIQDYFYTRYNYYFKPGEILLPKAYKNVGTFVKKITNNHSDFFDKLKRGDIIYAENFRNKKGEIIYKGRPFYGTEDEWILHFHSVIYLGKLDSKIKLILPVKSFFLPQTPVVWHASFIAGGTALWSIEDFLHYYKPVAAKRITKFK